MPAGDGAPSLRAEPLVYTIPPAIGFLDALADGIWAQAEGDPLRLGRMTILLPNRRACRALRDAFLRRRDGRPLLLPRLSPIGDVDEDELALAGGEELAAALDLPPAMTELRRRLLLARLILARGTAHGAAQASELARELARLIDQIETERVDIARLGTLVPADYAEHWQGTLRFLALLTDHWPRILADEGTVDASRRRNLLLEARLALWTKQPPADPVIAAGSTGSVPATADLLLLVARLPQGCVVLPGLDRDLDQVGWEGIDPSHPQYGLSRLLARFGIAREAVKDWPAAPLDRRARARARLISAAMRPASTTDAWRDIGTQIAGLIPEALDGLVRIECAGPQQEAGVIALLMRETLETPERTAALVTADRDLARRVAAELGRYGIAIDDSAGRPLAHTPGGAFLNLCAGLAAGGAAPIPLLSCLKHPFAAGGSAPAVFRRRVRRLEIVALRGPRHGGGLADLAAWLRGGTEGNADPEARELADWVSRIAAALGPFASLIDRGGRLADLVAAHVAFAEWLAASDERSGRERLWAGEDGLALAEFVDDLKAAADDFPALPGGEYPGLFEACLASHVARPVHGRHPRLAILGLLEARLLAADLLILGGLNEGSWPAEPPADPWMSRPMRERFGLPPLERRIGLSAHDFTQACNARQVVLTRATRVEGTPTVPSRWLQRLDNLLTGAGRLEGLPRRDDVVAWQQSRDRADRLPPSQAPAPCPPVAVRPRSLSVTQVETWRRDPYAIYARHILGLRPLEPLDADPGFADYGLAIHAALDAFVRRFPAALPADALARLLDIGRAQFGPALARPGVWAFWWPRFERIAAWFVAFESERRAEATPVATEARGEIVLRGPAGPFRLTAKADRIDRLADGRLAIIDYKTGGVPTMREVALGYAAQLPLEAAIAAAGGFAGVPAGAVAQLRYWRLTGGREAGSEIAIDGATIGHERAPLPEPAALAEEARAGLERLVALFDDAATPYHARPRPDYVPRFGDYDHLARVKEWSAVEEGE